MLEVIRAQSVYWQMKLLQLKKKAVELKETHLSELCINFGKEPFIQLSFLLPLFYFLMFRIKILNSWTRLAENIYNQTKWNIF
jgi:hypothetical protein